MAPAEVAGQIRKQIAAIDPHLPLYGVGSLTNMLGFALFPMHAAAIALSAFGLLAIVLAIIGIHGVVAYAAARRTHEFGIRIAIGARPFDVLRLVLARAAVLLLAGVAAGIVLSLAAGPVLAAVIYNSSPRDPAVLAAVVLLVAAAAGLSCWKPSIRAMHGDPADALRVE
jgi:ABC-type antimicrobial peptide transport system permease subunit